MEKQKVKLDSWVDNIMNCFGKRQKNINMGFSDSYIDNNYYDSIEESISDFPLHIRKSVLKKLLPNYSMKNTYKKKGDPCYFDTLTHNEIEIVIKKQVHK